MGWTAVVVGAAVSSVVTSPSDSFTRLWGRRRALLLPASTHAHDIPILKQAKAEYAKLQ